MWFEIADTNALLSHQFSIPILKFLQYIRYKLPGKYMVVIVLIPGPIFRG